MIKDGNFAGLAKGRCPTWACRASRCARRLLRGLRQSRGWKLVKSILADQVRVRERSFQHEGAQEKQPESIAWAKDVGSRR